MARETLEASSGFRLRKLGGDTLKLRMNDKFGGNNVSERPTGFSTAQGKEAVLFILKRGAK
jgi:hypothetical protein